MVVIEHNLEMMRVADHLIDLGPGGGKHGGKIVYQGDVAGIVEVPGFDHGEVPEKEIG